MRISDWSSDVCSSDLGLTLAPREGAKCVEPARDRRDEPAFAAAVSRDRTKDGRLRLVGPIGATEPLHGPIGAPARLKQKMNAALQILVIEDRMIGSARSSSVGKDENALGAVHECVGVCHASRWRSRLQLLATIWQTDEAFGASGDFGNGVGTESFDDGIEGGRERRPEIGRAQV